MPTGSHHLLSHKLAVTILMGLLAAPAVAEQTTQHRKTLTTIRVIGKRAAETAISRVGGLIATRSATGTKTDTPIIETPQSITVISSQQMQGVQSAEETLRYVAGTAGGAYGFDPRSDWMLIRGFDPARFLDGMALPCGMWVGATRQEVYGQCLCCLQYSRYLAYLLPY